MLEFGLIASMHPPVDPAPPETLSHAVESLKRSEKPLTAPQILELIPPPSRVDSSRLEGLLQQAASDKTLHLWPAISRKTRVRFWTVSPEDAAGKKLADLLAKEALSSS